MGFDVRSFHPERPPALLLGGLNLVRALGIARHPGDRRVAAAPTPALASRYPRGGLRAAAARTARSGGGDPARRRRAARRRARAPGPAVLRQRRSPRPGRQDHRAALAPHFALLLNEPDVARRAARQGALPGLRRDRGLPVPRPSPGRRSSAGTARCWSSRRRRPAATTHRVCAQLFGGAGKARIFASGREARARRSRAPLARRTCCSRNTCRGDDATLVVPRLRRRGRRGARLVRRPQDPHLARAHRRQLVSELAHDDALVVARPRHRRALRRSRRLQDGLQAQTRAPAATTCSRSTRASTCGTTSAPATA